MESKNSDNFKVILSIGVYTLQEYTAVTLKEAWDFIHLNYFCGMGVSLQPIANK